MDEKPVEMWAQLGLIPPEFIRLTCEILLDRPNQLFSFNVRAEYDESGNLGSSWTLPLRSWWTFDRDLKRCLDEFVFELRTHTEPFHTGI